MQEKCKGKIENFKIKGQCLIKLLKKPVKTLAGQKYWALKMSIYAAKNTFSKRLLSFKIGSTEKKCQQSN